MNSEKLFDSVVLAGGLGSRLSPLTENIPKPMMPVGDDTAFGYIAKLLKKHGFKNTAVTVMYLAEKIERYGSDGGRISYFREEKALGSAGALANISEKLDDVVLVISADAICNFDLSAAKSEFLKSGCEAGILLHRVRDVNEYGCVCVTDGVVAEFREKPSVRDTVSNLINTGIYFIKKSVLSRIKRGEASDFAKDIFPAMLRAGDKIAAIEPSGIWFDVGSFKELYRCNMFFSGGESVIGLRCSLHPSARIEKSLIFGGVTVGDSVIFGSIVASGAVIGNGCVIPAGCVIGENAELRDGVMLSPGSVIASDETVRPKEYFSGLREDFGFDDDAFSTDGLDAGYFVKLGRALGGDGKINVFSHDAGKALARSLEIACGASESGSDVTVISGGSESLASFAAEASGYIYTAHVSLMGSKFRIKLFGPDGMELSREKLREITAKKPSADGSGNVFLLPRGVIIKKYVEYLKSFKLPSRISVGSGESSSLLAEIKEELLLKSGGAIFNISPDGTKVDAKSESGADIDYWSILISVVIKSGRKEIFLPADTPKAVERIITSNGIATAFYGDSESDIRVLASSDRLARDGILLALTARYLCEKQGVTLDGLIENLPPLKVISRYIIADGKTMSATVGRLHDGKAERTAGFDFGDGRVSVFPSAKGRFRLIAEAADSETAEEITLRAIEELMKNE